MPSQADDDDRGTWTLVVENDLFGGTDRNYTNGVKLSYVSPDMRTPNSAKSVARTLFPGEGEGRRHLGFALGHSIFTPEDTETYAPLPDQHPYAGWLYGEISLVEARPAGLDSLVLQLGVVGPSALGEEVQNGFHELIDDDIVNGWDNQLHDEFGGVLTYEHKWRRFAQSEVFGIGLDLTPSAGFSVGNVLTQAKLGAMVRLGTDLPDDYGPPRIRPALAGPATFEPSGIFSWYIFTGIEGRAVAQNIFLDGNSDGDSLSVDKKTYVADAQAGVVFQLGGVQIGYTYVARTEEFKTQIKKQRFGAVTISTRF